MALVEHIVSPEQMTCIGIPFCVVFVPNTSKIGPDMSEIMVVDAHTDRKIETKSISLSIHSIGTILCGERWCCLSSLLRYWAQSWMGRHSDTGYQQAGTQFADPGRMIGSVNHLILIQQLRVI